MSLHKIFKKKLTVFEFVILAIVALTEHTHLKEGSKMHYWAKHGIVVLVPEAPCFVDCISCKSRDSITDNLLSLDWVE